MLIRSNRVKVRYLTGAILVAVWGIAVVSPAWAEGAGTAAAPEPPSQATGRPAATAARATGDLEEIVVTARRRTESQQEVPIAITVLKPETLERTGAFLISQFTELVPGLRVTAVAADSASIVFNIRGQGQAYGTLFPAVIPYFAEVPIPTNFSNGNFFDLEDVQVLRGPQGVQFGRVTDGGNVLIGPKRPTDEFGGYVQMTTGDYNLVGGEGALNVPIVEDTVLLRIAGEIKRRDGYTKNIATGAYTDDLNYETGRIGLILKPFDHFQNYTVYEYNHSDNGGTGTAVDVVNSAAVRNATGGLFGQVGSLYNLNASTGAITAAIPGTGNLSTNSFLAGLNNALARQLALGPRAVDDGAPLFDRRTNQYLVNQTTYDITDNLLVKNIFGYLSILEEESSDFDGTPLPYIDTTHTAGGGLPYLSQEQFSEEFQLQGTSADKRLDYTLGTYLDYQHPKRPYESYSINVGVLQRDAVYLTETYSKALYGQIEYNLPGVLDGLKVNGGIRYTEDRVDTKEATYTTLIPNEAFPIAPIPHGQCTNYVSALGLDPCNTYEQQFHAITWTGGFSYQVTPMAMAYVKASRGYRPGGTNETAPNIATAVYRPEYDQSEEIGLKVDWDLGNMKARTNLALYHDNYTDIQKLITLTDPVTGQPDSEITNAAHAVIQGIEFEGTLIPVEGLTLGLTWSYTDSRFINDGRTPYAALTSGDGVNNPNGYPATGACNPAASLTLGFCPYNLVAQTPKHQIGANIHYALPLYRSIGVITIGGNIYHQTSEALEDTSVLNPDIIEPGYTLINLDGRWESIYGRPLDLVVFVTNLTNKVYLAGAETVSNNASLGIGSNMYAPPRMFGASLRWRF